MNSSINRLYTELEWKCVSQRTAGSSEVFERWENDSAAYLRESFVFAPMPAQLEPLLNEVLAEWNQRQQKFLAKINRNEEEFLDDFRADRNDFLIEKNGTQPPDNQPTASEPVQHQEATNVKDSERRSIIFTGIVNFEMPKMPKLSPYKNSIYGVVNSMTEVSLFSWWLPAMNVERREELRSVGRLVIAIFYGELITNRREEFLRPKENVYPDPAETIAILEDRWHMVND